MKKYKFHKACFLSVALSFTMTAHAEESTMEKLETQKNKAVDSTKSTYREAKDESCEMVNGKMQCLGKKIKHKAENLSDKAKTTATEVKNKVD